MVRKTTRYVSTGLLATKWKTDNYIRVVYTVYTDNSTTEGEKEHIVQTDCVVVL